jgi:MYND finger
MGKRTKKNTAAFLAAAREKASATGEPMTLSRLQMAADGECAYCKAESIKHGGLIKLKKCGRCCLVFYCSKECQATHWPDHKVLCNDKQRQKSVVNSSILSAAQLIKDGQRILCGEDAIMVGRHQVSIPPAPALSWPLVGTSVVRVSVSNADRSRYFEINALFSAAADASSVSERLATMLGLSRNGLIDVAGFREWMVDGAYFPSSSVDVQCLDIVSTSGGNVIPSSTRMALVIAPHPGKELVLGRDWLNSMARQASRSVALDHAPDKTRMRFLELDPSETLDASHFPAESAIDEGDFIAVHWGKPDPGPEFQEDAVDMTHIISPDVYGRQHLDHIAMSTGI